MEEAQLRKSVLSGKKSQRIALVANDEMKVALERASQEKCVSLPVLKTLLVTKKILKNVD